MLLIVQQHFFGHSAQLTSRLSPTHEGTFSSADLWSAGFYYMGFGRIGVDLFFMTSAWFLCAKESDALNGISKALTLERKVLFYSICILAISIPFVHTSAMQIARSILPTLTGAWWYVTSFVFFLLIYPALTKGLRALNQIEHRNLVITIWVMMWSTLILPQYVNATAWSSISNLLLFPVLYITIAYIRWYYPKLMSKPSHTALRVLTVVVLLSINISLFVVLFFKAYSGGSHPNTSYQLLKSVFASYSPVSVIVSIIILSIVLSHPFESRLVNWLAANSFGVYLLHENVIVAPYLWNKSPLSWVMIPNQTRLIVATFIIPIIVYLIGIAFDQFSKLAIRLISHISLPRNWSRLFSQIIPNIHQSHKHQ